MSIEEQIDWLQYDAKNTSPYTLEENQKVVGKKASLTITGEIVDAGESEAGSYIKFKVDERWGFPFMEIVMDRDPFQIQEKENA
jgi:hypothetical protein